MKYVTLTVFVKPSVQPLWAQQGGPYLLGGMLASYTSALRHQHLILLFIHILES